MIEPSTHCHRRYNHAEDNLANTKHDGIEVSSTRGLIKKWLLYPRVNDPLVPMELRDTSALESRTQMYFQLVDDL